MKCRNHDSRSERARRWRRRGLACAADLRFAATSAKFVTAFANVGLSGDFGGTWTLPRIVGASRARDLYLLSDAIDGTEAERIGLVSRVFPDATFRQEVRLIAERLAGAAPVALRNIKANLNDGERLGFVDAMMREAERHVRSGATDGPARPGAPSSKSASLCSREHRGGSDRDLRVGGLFPRPRGGTPGLHNFLMPVGSNFLEVVAPSREGTAGGRYLDRRGGDGDLHGHHPMRRSRGRPGTDRAARWCASSRIWAKAQTRVSNCTRRMSPLRSWSFARTTEQTIPHRHGAQLGQIGLPPGERRLSERWLAPRSRRTIRPP